MTGLVECQALRKEIFALAIDWMSARFQKQQDKCSQEKMAAKQVAAYGSWGKIPFTLKSLRTDQTKPKLADFQQVPSAPAKADCAKNCGCYRSYFCVIRQVASEARDGFIAATDSG